ncbi:MAG TPA: hypothetical protein DD706_21520 [Nitrospiraceae bacterium]|nr:hypothetical protein [Nitrospiraceae bacterium]
MSIQLVAKGHHMRNIVRNGEGEAGRACELAVTKRRADQMEPIFTLSKIGREPERRQKKTGSFTNEASYIIGESKVGRHSRKETVLS